MAGLRGFCRLTEIRFRARRDDLRLVSSPLTTPASGRQQRHPGVTAPRCGCPGRGPGKITGVVKGAGVGRPRASGAAANRPDARQAVLDAAGELFTGAGYAATTTR